MTKYIKKIYQILQNTKILRYEDAVFMVQNFVLYKIHWKQLETELLI